MILIKQQLAEPWKVPTKAVAFVVMIGHFQNVGVCWLILATFNKTLHTRARARLELEPG